MSVETTHDPRARLVREKYFSLRPRPLERWLWSQGIPASAERVFWLHWQEGLQRGDWCSEVPLKRVARECCLDTSTVTRAYQLLARLGCLRRTDPGRDAANPFQQATAVTEVRVPRELLQELSRHPNRRSDPVPQSQRSPASGPAGSRHSHRGCGGAAAGPLRRPARSRARPGARTAVGPDVAAGGGPVSRSRPAASDPHGVQPGLEAERRTAGQGAAVSGLPRHRTGDAASVAAAGPPAASKVGRKLSVFELARLRRDIQAVTSAQDAPETLRQVIWSIEEGSLLRFSPLHAAHIALKKIREGAWTRPHRMPPNWVRGCRHRPRPAAVHNE